MNRITITIYGNELRIGFHTNKRLTDKTVYGGSGGEDAGQAAKDFHASITGQNGITEASLKNYELTIERGEAFDWPEVVPGVLDMLASYCGFDKYELRIKDDRSSDRYDSDGNIIGTRYLDDVHLGVSPNNPYERDMQTAA